MASGRFRPDPFRQEPPSSYSAAAEEQRDLSRVSIEDVVDAEFFLLLLLRLVAHVAAAPQHEPRLRAHVSARTCRPAVRLEPSSFKGEFYFPGTDLALSGKHDR